MIARLIPVRTTAASQEIYVDALPAVVGRGATATIRLRDPWVSRTHCELVNTGGELLVRDLGSKHGTFVNGQQVHQSSLHSGDRLGFGLTHFEVVLEQAQAGPGMAHHDACAALPA